MVHVTIVTATYNRSAVLPDAIASVLQQDYPDFEYLIVDDGSTDDTARVVTPFLSDNRIHYFARPHRGQAAALNWALAHAKTPYICFLDSDDQFMPNHVSVLLGAMQKNKKLDFVLGRFLLQLPEGKKPSECRVADFFHPGKQIPVQKVEYASGILFGKQKKLRAAGGFHSPFADVRLIMRMQKMGFCWQRVSKKTYVYRFLHAKDSLSRKESNAIMNSREQNRCDFGVHRPAGSQL